MKAILLAAFATFALIVAVNAASNGRPNYGNSGDRPIACPLIGCGPGCRSVPVPGGCPRCECPRPGRPNYGPNNALMGCPLVGCISGCHTTPVPGGCPKCECPRPGGGGGGNYGR